MDLKSPNPPTNDQPVEPPADTKPKKEKKPATPAQQAARQKGLEAMMAKRKQISEEVKVKKEKVKVAKKIVEDKILKEDLGFVSYKDFEDMKKQVFELKGMLSVKQQAEKEKPVAAPKQERIVERVIERVPTPVSQPAKLTGTALLDRLFFDK